MTRLIAGLAGVIAFTMSLATPALAQEAEPSRVLFTNVSVFNGLDDGLDDGQ